MPQYVNRAERADQMNVTKLRVEAAACVLQQDFEQALDNVLDALAAEPRNEELHLVAGQLHDSLDQSDAAERHFREALSINGSSISALCRLATFRAAQPFLLLQTARPPSRMSQQPADCR